MKTTTDDMSTRYDEDTLLGVVVFDVLEKNVVFLFTTFDAYAGYGVLHLILVVDSFNEE